MRSTIKTITGTTRSVRPLLELVGFAGALATLYQVFGILGAGLGVGSVLLYYTVQRYRHIERVDRMRRSLLAELPNHHAFLVDFLRETYSLPRDEILNARNQGALITEYVNRFVVTGTNCENHQEIRGKNLGSGPLRGVAFALVGGSSVRAADLSATYQANSGPAREPTFIVDRDRFKIAFCEFREPIAPGAKFEVLYMDSWAAAMRAGADGFFFPEAIYFPAGVQRLVIRVEFSFAIASIAVLEVDIEQGKVFTCREQPAADNSLVGTSVEYGCEIERPSSRSVYVLYYAAVP